MAALKWRTERSRAATKASWQSYLFIKVGLRGPGRFKLRDAGRYSLGHRTALAIEADGETACHGHKPGGGGGPIEIDAGSWRACLQLIRRLPLDQRNGPGAGCFQAGIEVRRWLTTRLLGDPCVCRRAEEKSHETQQGWPNGELVVHRFFRRRSRLEPTMPIVSPVTGESQLISCQDFLI